MFRLIRFLDKLLFPIRYFWRFVARGARLGGALPEMTWAGKIATTLCLLMLTLWVGFFVYFLLDDSRNPDFFPFFVGAPVCMVLITLFCYYGIKQLKLEQVSPYPEIDTAFKEIGDWLEKEQIEFDRPNYYLVFGSEDENTCKNLYSTSQNINVRGIPIGAGAWMHWYGNHSDIHLHVKECSLYNSRLKMCPSGVVRDDDPGWHTMDPDSDMNTDLMGEDDEFDPEEINEDSSDIFSPTVDADSEPDLEDSDINLIATEPKSERLVSDEETHEMLDRLKYVCESFQKHNHYNVPIKGVVVLIPFDRLIYKNNALLLAEGASSDIREIQIVMGTAVPVTFLIVGMEKQAGFAKLINLLGKEKKMTGRLGTGVKVGDFSRNSRENLQLLAEKACIQFEAWVQKFFKKAERLGQAAENQQLYELVVDVRTVLQPKLTSFFEKLIVTEDGLNPDEILVAGCYFSATGEGKREEHGFVNGAMAKIKEMSRFAGWTQTRAERDRLYSFGANLLTLLGILCFIAAAVLILIKLFQ